MNAHKELVKLLQAGAYRTNVWDVFRDFLEMAALSIANAIDLAQREPREERYLSIIRRYEREDQERFPRMFALLVQAMEERRGDVMGAILGELELGNSARGQFFTPDHVCRLMADVQVGDGSAMRELIAQKGFITLSEPTVGGGAMVIAYAEAMQAAGLNYQQHLHVTAQDVDPRAVHMAFVQFSLLHIPAVLILGNTLAMEQREIWYTPAHILGFWVQKLHRGYALGSAADLQPINEDTPVVPMPPSDFNLQGELFAQSEAA